MRNQLRITVLLLCVNFTLSAENLYGVLQVKKTATQKEIKQAYKKLARESHPDKTDDPDATDRFTKINEAYETLGNVEKRREYDDYGYTSASGRQQQPRQRGFQQFQHFDSFFGGSGFEFNFGGGGGGGSRSSGGESYIDKILITMRQYETTILPNSAFKPCILYLFTDYCLNCIRIEGIVEKFMQEAKGYGLCVAAVHAQRAGNLASHLRVQQVPSIVGVIDEKVSYFRGGASSANLHNYVKNLFPAHFFTKVKDSNIQSFLDGWVDNRVRAIFFCSRDDMHLRFLALAYYYRENVAFGFVYTRSPESTLLLAKYNVNKNRETLLLFNEEPGSPVASISMQQLSRSSLDEVIEGNKFLSLPRLSSQKYFEELCPAEYKAKNRKLCVVLFTKKGPEDDPERDVFRRYSQGSSLSTNDRVKFTYLYEDTQQEFVRTLTKGKQRNEKQLMLAIIWRMEKNQLRYEWLEQGWSLEQDRLCSKALENRLNVLLTTDSIMPYKIVPPTLYNEHGLGLLTRIGYKLWSWIEKVTNYFSVVDNASWITIILSLTFVFGMGYFMHKLATLEEIQVKSTLPQKTRPRPPSRTFDEKSLKLYELDYRSYTELVSEADTGLTITLLVDKDSKDKLVKTYAKICHPYSRYSGLTFSFLQLEYNIKWYRNLLEQSIDDIKLDNINIKNCIGTVIAINGFRKYYYIYSAKRARQFIRKRNNVSQALGLDDLDEVSDNEDTTQFGDYFFLDEVLEGLGIWLDKIFDGSMKRIRINKWPEMKD